MAHVTTPHFSLPFRINGVKGAAHCEQDTEEEIFYCVEAALRYTIGHRPEKPEFGIPDLTFSEGRADQRRIQEALDFWEPRIQMLANQSVIDKIDELVQSIRIEVAQL